MSKKKLTQERLKELLNYDPDTGIFTWRVYKRNVSPGDVAGGINKNTGGYIQIGIDHVRYYGHRLAWLWCNKHFPDKDVYHINGNKSDNRIENIKESSVPCKELTQERLKKLLTYDPNTGVFVCKVNRRRVAKKGDTCGFIRDNGYVVISLNDKEHRAHRLAWLYVYGYFPENGIDHINRNPSDNRIKNLREVSQSCNIRNTGNFSNNTSGVKGVSFVNRENRWVAYIDIYRKRKTLGRYKSFDNAVCSRLAMEQCLGWEGCDSSSPAYKYVQENIVKFQIKRDIKSEIEIWFNMRELPYGDSCNASVWKSLIAWLDDQSAEDGLMTAAGENR